MLYMYQHEVSLVLPDIYELTGVSLANSFALLTQILKTMAPIPQHDLPFTILGTTNGFLSAGDLPFNPQ